MHYDSFLDFIQAEGCSWVPLFDTSFGSFYQNKYNSKVAFLEKDRWVSSVAAITLCLSIDIDVPAEFKDKEAAFDELGLF